jgi:Zn-dependent protease with chaperone function
MDFESSSLFLLCSDRLLTMGTKAENVASYPFGHQYLKGYSLRGDGFALLLIMSVEFALISPLFGLVVSWFSRRAEYRADRQAVTEGYGEALILSLKKLARENFVHLAPAKLLVVLEYSHPPLSQRIREIENKLS